MAWQRGYGTPAPHATKADGDADDDLAVDATDLSVWQTQFGTQETLVAAATIEVSPATVAAPLFADYAAAVATATGPIDGNASLRPTRIGLFAPVLTGKHIRDEVFHRFDSPDWLPGKTDGQQGRATAFAKHHRPIDSPWATDTEDLFAEPDAEESSLDDGVLPGLWTFGTVADSRTLLSAASGCSYRPKTVAIHTAAALAERASGLIRCRWISVHTQPPASPDDLVAVSSQAG